MRGLIEMKHSAYERAAAQIHQLEAARAATDPRLYAEVRDGYQVFADFILLRRDWASYILMQYAIEKGVYKPERKVLGRPQAVCEASELPKFRIYDRRHTHASPSRAQGGAGFNTLE